MYTCYPDKEWLVVQLPIATNNPELFPFLFFPLF